MNSADFVHSTPSGSSSILDFQTECTPILSDAKSQEHAEALTLNILDDCNAQMSEEGTQYSFTSKAGLRLPKRVFLKHFSTDKKMLLKTDALSLQHGVSELVILLLLVPYFCML